MNILYLTISRISEIESRGIYSDLMRKFRREGHRIYIASPSERRFKQPRGIISAEGVDILRVKTLNIQKVNIIEKGLSTLLLESQFKRAIQKYWQDVKFDLILYSTPPITFANVIQYLKKQNPQAISYLLLKDIFPQNAVDLGMLSQKGIKGVLYRWFRRKEKFLYHLSDHIGCMSPANMRYIIDHNPEIAPEKVELAPNSIELTEPYLFHKDEIRLRYKLPLDKLIFIYGGNLGKPQGVDFLCKVLEKNCNREDCHFLIVGDGTESHKISKWIAEKSPQNITQIARLPKEEYDGLVRACDVGLIFLDHRFTIPNYPSRLLSYLEYKMPILVASDPNTDIGKIAEENHYGYWCESDNPEEFTKLIDRFAESPESIRIMGDNGFKFLKNNYLVEHTYSAIIKHYKY